MIPASRRCRLRAPTCARASERWPRRSPAVTARLLLLTALALLVSHPVVVHARQHATTGVVPSRPAGVTVGEVVANVDAYLGQEVSVAGDVDDMLGPHAFTIEDDSVLTHAELPILIERPLAGAAGCPLGVGPLEDGGRLLPSHVLVTGTVRQFDPAALDGWLGLDPGDARREEWSGRPVLVAHSIVPRPVSLGWQAATVDAVARPPDLYLGRDVTVRGVVYEAVGQRAFVLEDDDLLLDEELLVVAADPLLDRDGRPLAIGTLVGRRVWVTGTVRPFALADVERELSASLGDGFFGAWRGRPAIVARSIRPAPGC